MGDAVFEQMVGVMQRGHTPLRTWSGKIDREEYEQWRKDFIWEALHGQRYGQSFCNYFGVTNYVLWYATDWRRADEIIRNYYIA